MLANTCCGQIRRPRRRVRIAAPSCGRAELLTCSPLHSLFARASQRDPTEFVRRAHASRRANMPLLSSLVLPTPPPRKPLASSLQNIAPPVLSVEALLEQDLEALEAQIDLPRGAPLQFLRAVAHHYAPLRNASTLEDEEVLTPTSCAAIDALLGGGFRTGDVAEVVGPTCAWQDPTITSNSFAERLKEVETWPGSTPVAAFFSPARARAMKGRLDLIRVCFAEDAQAMLPFVDVLQAL